VPKLTLLLCPLLLLAACHKVVEPAEQFLPKMSYKNLADTAIVFGRGASFDMDGNGTKDIYFGTQLVGDPIEKHDKKQWLVVSSFNTNLPVNVNENIPVINANDNIPIEDFSGYSWYNASEIVLAQKIITLTGSYWDGQWKEASHRFVPLQIKTENHRYNGWVEISFNATGEKLILHRAAICSTPDVAIEAGK